MPFQHGDAQVPHASFQVGEFMTSMDYISGGISPHTDLINTLKIPQFCEDNTHLPLRVLPFGLSTIPRVFTKVLVNATAFLQKQEIHV